jgi:hypothetical protein
LLPKKELCYPEEILLPSKILLPGGNFATQMELCYPEETLLPRKTFAALEAAMNSHVKVL